MVASDEDEDGRTAARMSAGLFTAQQCAIIMASLWASGDLGVRKRLLQLLHQRVRPLPAPAPLPIFCHQHCTLSPQTPGGLCNSLY